MPRNAPTRTPRRRLLLAGAVLVVLPLTWATYHTLQGGRQLLAARDGLGIAQEQLRATDDARPALAKAGDSTRRARAHLGDPVVRALSSVPVLGEPLQSARSLAIASDLAVRTGLLPLLSAAGPDPAARLFLGAGQVDVDYLATLAQPAEVASRALSDADRVLDSAPVRSGVTRLDEARDDLAEELTDLRALVDDAALGTALAPDLLGREGVRRYLVVSQSPAEARGTGGLIGGYTLVEAAGGALRVLRSGVRDELTSSGDSVVDLGREYDAHYGLNGPTLGWINSNLSPHFPYAAQIWTALWERQFPERLDGAVLLDPVSLSYLLAATGPVTLDSTGDTIDADNVVDATLRDVYDRFPEETERDAYLQSVSSAVTSALTTRDVPGRPLVAALSQGVQAHRLRLWLRDPALQRAIEPRTVAGGLPAQPRAVGDTIVDASGSKLDYYLDRALAYTQGCGGPSRLALTLTNDAPPSGLPDYVTPAALREGAPAGTNRMIVTLYLPAGATDVTLRVGGQPADASRTGSELGLVWVETTVELQPGQGTSVEATFIEAALDQPLRQVVQPLVRPEPFTAAGC